MGLFIVVADVMLDVDVAVGEASVSVLFRLLLMFLSTLKSEGATCCSGVVAAVAVVLVCCCSGVATNVASVLPRVASGGCTVHSNLRGCCGFTSFSPASNMSELFRWSSLLLLRCLLGCCVLCAVSVWLVAVGVAFVLLLLLLLMLLLASGVCSITSWEPAVEVVVAAVAAIVDVADVALVSIVAVDSASGSSTNSASYCSNSVSLPPISGVMADASASISVM